MNDTILNRMIQGVSMSDLMQISIYVKREIGFRRGADKNTSRLQNILNEHFFGEIENLQEITEDEFLQIKNAGKHTLVQARGLLKKKNLIFRQK